MKKKKCEHKNSNLRAVASGVDKRVFYDTAFVGFCSSCGVPTMIDLSTFNPPIKPNIVDLLKPKFLDDGMTDVEDE